MLLKRMLLDTKLLETNLARNQSRSKPRQLSLLLTIVLGSANMLSPEQTSMFSYFVLGAAVAAFAGWGWVAWKRTRYSVAQAPIYLYALMMTRVVWRVHIDRKLPLQDNQGAIIVCNHISGIDPGFIAQTTNRPVHWMVAREYCEHPAVAWAFRTLGCIPVNRGGVDTKATKLSIRLLQQGHLVGLFPEGRINDTDQILLPGRPGVALLALKARVPVIPCYVSGSPLGGTVFSSLWMTAHARLRVGDPIDFSEFWEQADKKSERAVLEDITKRMLQEIANLAGVYDYQPRLAGRRWKPGQESADPAALESQRKTQVTGEK